MNVRRGGYPSEFPYEAKMRGPVKVRKKTRRASVFGLGDEKFKSRDHNIGRNQAASLGA
jgi:hypothetical protein